MSNKQKNQENKLNAFGICFACGAKAERETTKFCAVCNCGVHEDYQPLDALRASYNLPQLKIRTDSNQSDNKMRKLFGENKNNAASTALAFVVYSLVPYLGILFCPGALLMGGVGLAVSYQKPQLGGRETACYSLLIGAIVFGIQIALWYLLYVVPELGRNI